MDQAKTVSHEMLNMRGYKLKSESEDSSHRIFSNAADHNIIVFFDTHEKINKNILSKYNQLMNDLNIKESILVYSGTITTTTSKLIDALNQSKQIQIFNIDELTFNITKHVLQPNFEKLSIDDKNEVINLLGRKIPIMRYNDAISKFYNYKKGDIIQVTNKQNVISYRIVK